MTPRSPALILVTLAVLVSVPAARPQEFYDEVLSGWWQFHGEPLLRVREHVHDGSGPEGVGCYPSRDPDESTSIAPTEAQIREMIVPALRRALASSENRDVVGSSLIALARIGGGPGDDLPAFVASYLAHENDGIREDALIALAILADPASVPVLTPLVRWRWDEERRGEMEWVPPRRRAFAAYALARIGATNDDEGVRREVSEHFAAYVRGPQSLDVAVACTIGLGLVPPAEDAREARLAFLAEILHDRSRHVFVRAHAATALARLVAAAGVEAEKERVVLELIEAMGSRRPGNDRTEPDLIRSGVLALGLLGDGDDDPVDRRIRSRLLRASLEEEDVPSRAFALVALARTTARPGRGTNHAENAKRVVELLAEHVHSRDRDLAPWAALGLGLLVHGQDEPASVPHACARARKALRDAFPHARRSNQISAIALASALADDPEVGPALLVRLNEDRDVGRQSSLCVALGLLDYRPALESMNAVVRESKYRPALLYHATTGLALHGDKELVPRLINLLDDAAGLATQASYLWSLGRVGDKRAVLPLVTFLGNEEKTPSAHGFAAYALGALAAREDLLWTTSFGTDTNFLAAPPFLAGDEGDGILDWR